MNTINSEALPTGCCLSAHRPSSHMAGRCQRSVQTAALLDPTAVRRCQNASVADSWQSDNDTATNE